MILGLLTMFYLMFLNLDLVLALVHLLSLHQNFGMAYLMICVLLSLLLVLNPSLKRTYFVKLSLKISALLIFILLCSPNFWIDWFSFSFSLDSLVVVLG